LSGKSIRRQDKMPSGRISPLRVIIDSNFLITPTKYHIDIFDEIPRILGRSVELIVPTGVYKEIDRATRQKGTGNTSLALTLTKKCKIINVQTRRGEGVDDTLVRLAQEWGTPVATNDRSLRKRLRARRIPVLSMRGKGQLELHGIIE
jgi:rRNA-processing protein FCF1